MPIRSENLVQQKEVLSSPGLLLWLIEWFTAQPEATASVLAGASGWAVNENAQFLNQQAPRFVVQIGKDSFLVQLSKNPPHV